MVADSAYRIRETRPGLAASLGDADGQPVTRCLQGLHSDQGAAFQLGFETGQDLSNLLEEDPITGNYGFVE
jgi:hypothetical protein